MTKIHGNRKHFAKGTRLYTTWKNMNRRCDSPCTDSYQYYGARGITVCEEWRTDFIKFRKWAILNGYKDHLTIDRKDNNKN